MQKGQKVKPRSLKGGKSISSAKEKIGTGARFTALSEKLKKQGVKRPKSLAAALGRAKLGTKKMSKIAAAGRKRAAK